MIRFALPLSVKSDGEACASTCGEDDYMLHIPEPQTPRHKTPSPLHEAANSLLGSSSEVFKDQSKQFGALQLHSDCRPTV